MANEEVKENNAGDFALDMGDYGIPAQELHCPKCRRFLGYTAIAWGAIRIKCSNCKTWTTLDVSPKKS